MVISCLPPLLICTAVLHEKAEAFYAALEDPSDTSPVEHGLNSRLILKDGVVQEEVYKTDGKYGPALEQVCYWLEKAAEVAENPRQAEYIHTLIAYYKTGDLALWDAFNIAWVQDTDLLQILLTDL